MTMIKLVKEKDDPICLRASIGGTETEGYYCVYRGDKPAILKMLHKVIARLSEPEIQDVLDLDTKWSKVKTPKKKKTPPAIMYCEKCGQVIKPKSDYGIDTTTGFLICEDCNKTEGDKIDAAEHAIKSRKEPVDYQEEAEE